MRSVFIPMCILLLLAFTASAEPAPGRSDTFVIGDTTTPVNLDPAQTSAMIDIRILRGMYQTLVVLGDDGVTLEPGAAESWEVSEDGLVYTFHLQPDAKWSDGSSVTAVDFVAGWFRAVLPDTWGDFASMHFVIAGARDFYNWRRDMLYAYHEAGEEVGFEQILSDLRTAQQRYVGTVGVLAVDVFTLQVTLERPVAYFPQLVSMLTFAPLPRVHLEPERLNYHVHGAARVLSEYFTDPELVICNGPYRLEQYEEGGDVRLVVNEHYWNTEDVRTPRVLLRILSEEALLAAYERGEVDWVPSVWPAEHRDALVASGRDDVNVLTTVGTYYYEFNCRAEAHGQPNPFADRAFRRSFAHAMNREAICERVGGGATPMGTFIPPGIMPGYESPADAALPFDLERAAELLEAAGHADGERQAGFDLLVTDLSVHVPIAQLLIEDWTETLGVTNITLHRPRFADYLEESQLGNFHIRRGGWFGDYHDPTTFLDLFRQDSPNNDSGYDSDAFNDLMKAADGELDPTARLALLREAEALLLQDAVVVPLYRYGTVSLYDPDRVYVPTNAWNYVRLEHLEHLRSE